MKIKVTLLFTAYDKTVDMVDINHNKIFLNDELEFPYCYLAAKDPSDAINEICYNNFRFDPSWLMSIVSGFRKISPTEFEVVYLSSRPMVKNSIKLGDFYTMYEVLSSEKQIDPYYEQILRSHNFFVV